MGLALRALGIGVVVCGCTDTATAIANRCGLDNPKNVWDSWRVSPSNGPIYMLDVYPPQGMESLDWMLFDQNVPLSEYGNPDIEFFDMHPNAPAFEITAFSPEAGVFTMAPLARADHDMQLTISGTPSPVPAKITTDVAIELPWPVTVHSLAPGFAVLRPCGRGSQRCRTYGLGTLSFLTTPSTTMPWHIDSYAPPMDADTALASFDAELGNGTMVSLELGTHTLGAPSTITVPDFQTTRVNGGPLSELTITTQADAYDHAAAFLNTYWRTDSVTGQPLQATIWRIFTYRGASLTSRSLPRLPAKMQGADIGGAAATGTAWVLLGVDDAHPPWSSATLDGVAAVAATR